MTRTLIAAALALLAVPSLRAADKPPKPPAGPQPQVLMARIDGDLILSRYVFRPVLEERVVRATTVDGKTIEKRTTEMKMVPVTTTIRFPLAKVHAIVAAGNKLAGRVLKARLEGDTQVVVSADGRPVDPFYLKVLKADTPVLVIDGFKPALMGLVPAPPGAVPLPIK